jgi:hypothetical protein
MHQENVLGCYLRYPGIRFEPSLENVIAALAVFSQDRMFGS